MRDQPDFLWPLLSPILGRFFRPFSRPSFRPFGRLGAAVVTLGICFGLELLAPAAAWAQGHGVLNGGGSGEYSVIFAARHLRDLLRDCRDVSCQPDAEEHGLLERVIESSARMPNASFKKQDVLHADLFRLIGGEVWINQDLIWLDTEKTRPYDLSAAVALWIEILSAREGLDPQLTARLASQARGAFSHEVLRGQIEIGQTFEYLVWRQRGANDRFVVRDPALSTVDLTDSLQRDLACAQTPTFEIFAPAWEVEVRDDARPETLTLSLRFGINWSCGSNESRRSFGQLWLKAGPDDNGTLVFDETSFFIHIEK